MRRLRMYLPGIPAHVVQRGHNRAACFLHEAVYLISLDELAAAARRHEVEIHVGTFPSALEKSLARVG